ncbi:MAG: bacillithiol biosynthesis cysteine-adding enzyme BshC [Bacteroidia bacterium]
MKKSFLDFSKTGILPPLVSDYLNDVKSLADYYSFRPELNSFEKAIEQKKKEKTDRKTLVEVLSSQYKNIFQNDFEFNRKVESNIESLGNENTFTVCTGHQLNIFTGPLYFLYKIISTINLSQKLTTHYPHYNFIPVYWMASEDHDFEEINHIHLFGKKIEWKQDKKGACGRIPVETIKLVLKELKSIIGESENARKLLQLFEQSYLENKNLADATRYLLHNLFSKYGLVIIDGDDKNLKTLFSEIMKDDVLNNTAFKKLNETILKLGAAYKPQVNPREINLFYLQENERERIEKNDSQFTIHNSQLKFQGNELLNKLEKHPENFSPNVVLRPLYAEKVLPNIAYVGGPAEISYWLEYKDMFDYYKISFPVLMLRNCVLWIDESVEAKLKKLNLSIENLFLPVDDLIKKHITEGSDSSISFLKEMDEVQNIYESIKRKSEQADHSLIAAIEGEKQRTISSLRNLEAKLLRTEKKKHETSIQQVRKIKEKIFPENSFQERYDSFIPYYLKFGEQFIYTLKENLNPFDFRLTVISEKD